MGLYQEIKRDIAESRLIQIGLWFWAGCFVVVIPLAIFLRWVDFETIGVIGTLIFWALFLVGRLLGIAGTVLITVAQGRSFWKERRHLCEKE